MYQSQILPPGSHLKLITLIYVANLGQTNILSKKILRMDKKVLWKSVLMISNCIKKMFSVKQTLKMDKKYTEKVLLWLQFAFFHKIKIFFLHEFGIFEVFSNLAAWWQNLRLVHNSTLFSWLFDAHLDPGSALI